ncbi:MAG: methyltransferase domain-containing protein [Proteobacteria bacterium]|nr:methyltransferase domain-containing protein [Desulfobacterales bacterium]MBL7101797.1 methyltransferase domain-containing protein [Desulfobacteraceae bacterium]MBL7172402.1 methyltransferase domain-containing protein [Desulfobacteraceae bacterium]MBU0733824.1 methyltransferase domain-containing protein [Pseudomonadota bacterium]MBU1902608.1 methyltransferase domain-containing protein [Pseudomonadota bacterium]
MKKILLKMLICPACLPDERRLNSNIVQEQEGDIFTGTLTCPECGKIYPIQDGTAFLDPSPLNETEKTGAKYETVPVLSSYLWSHYNDILNDSDRCAYGVWAALMGKYPGFAVDAGCAVGRFTFEMSRKSEFVIGVDKSVSFIQAARELMINRRINVALQQEGFLTTEETIYLSETWNSNKVEFIVGDAQALPFRSGTFSTLASLNVIDKVPSPIRHLKEMNRVSREKDAQFLFSDPFSWSTDIADEKDWLGGTDGGPYSGRGMDNIRALFNGKKGGLSPEWRIEKDGHVWWKIRNHANHFELIRSCFVKAAR